MKREVLRAFRLLHRACRNLFQSDHEAMNAARLKIRAEFLKNRSVSDPEELAKLVAEVHETEKFIRTSVVQGVLTKENTYRLRITEDTHLIDSPPLPEHLRKPKST